MGKKKQQWRNIRVSSVHLVETLLKPAFNTLFLAGSGPTMETEFVYRGSLGCQGGFLSLFAVARHLSTCRRVRFCYHRLWYCVFLINPWYFSLPYNHLHFREYSVLVDLIIFTYRASLIE